MRGWGGVLFALLLAAPAGAQVVYFRDADGVLHFRNGPAPGYAAFDAPEPLAASLTFPERPARPRAGYDALIAEYADRYGVERALVKAVMRAESAFDRLAVSRKGARGLMQLMPATARLHDVANVWSPRDNIHGGVKHLRLLLDRYGMNLPWVLAAYNAGTWAVERHRGIPPYDETREYVGRVLRYRRQYLREQRLAAK
ncbi:MAG: lytic transglycosylase domain-containing protein [Candidatus Binatia bacterium]